MLTTFNECEIRDELARVPWVQAAAFGAACVQRLLPAYHQFRDETGFGDYGALAYAIEVAWSVIERPGLGHDDALRRLLPACEHAGPEEDSHDTFLASLACDATLGVCSLIDSILNKSTEGFALAARYVTDAVDLYVQETEGMDAGDPGRERKICTHSLMQQELRRQRRDLDRLAASSIDVIQVLHDSANHENAFVLG